MIVQPLSLRTLARADQLLPDLLQVLLMTYLSVTVLLVDVLPLPSELLVSSSTGMAASKCLRKDPP